MSIFPQNFDFSPKFRFSPKISILPKISRAYNIFNYNTSYQIIFGNRLPFLTENLGTGENFENDFSIQNPVLNSHQIALYNMYTDGINTEKHDLFVPDVQERAENQNLNLVTENQFPTKITTKIWLPNHIQKCRQKFLFLDTNFPFWTKMFYFQRI